MKNRIMSISIVVLTAISFTSIAQISLNREKMIVKLKEHIQLLASDSLQGREAGTEGERMAAEYIVSQFAAIGLIPKGINNSYLHPFSFSVGVEAGKTNSLSMKVSPKNLPSKINLIKVSSNDFSPLAYSSNGKANGELVYVGFGIIAPTLDHNDYQGKKDLKQKIFLMQLGSPDGIHPHSKYSAFSDMRQKIDTAISRGASAIIFINSDTSVANPNLKDSHIKITPSSIPVLFYKDSKIVSLLEQNKVSAELETELRKIESNGKNVIGFLDNKAENTVVMGAHYDHLGMGEEGSLHRGAKAIHNGADDNASGVAAILEMARFLKQAGPKFNKNNYLFIAFSGEEKGLYGSSSFTKDPTLSLSTINYMINLDMVGRLNEEKKLAINGVGTSPAWMPILNALTIDSLHIKTSESGIGPSDHTSFYLKDIPAIHFFTGSHGDYHKPSDDEALINYWGLTSVVKYILSLVEGLNDSSKIVFTKTKDEKSEDAPRFKVTLGVVPDYLFDGEGMRIDGVNDGKPASNAGLLEGDIVQGIGENKVVDMMSYMKALSKFSKGDKTSVKVLRGKEILEKEITF